LLERLMFIGVVSLCDDEGICKAEARYLKGALFPYDDISLEDIEAARDRLHDSLAGFSVYEGNDGKEYVQLTRWSKYQTLKKPTPSDNPKPAFKKTAIPMATRREIARRHGLDGIGNIEAQCHWCGKVGRVCWVNASWVHFSGLELDHIVPESRGGDHSPDNIVLACRSCNRRRNNEFMDNAEGISRLEPSHTQVSTLREEKRREEKGKEEKRSTRESAETASPSSPGTPSSRVCTAFENLCPGRLTLTIKQGIDYAISDYGEAAVLGAIKIAATRGKQSWSYIHGILQNAASEGKLDELATGKVKASGHKRGDETDYSKYVQPICGGDDDGEEPAGAESMS